MSATRSPPDGRFLYVARPGKVSVVETTPLEVVATIDTPSGDSNLAGGAADIVATPDGMTVYRSSTCCAVLSVVADSVSTGSFPMNVAIEAISM